VISGGGNTRQWSAGVRRHKGNSLDPRKTISWNWWCILHSFARETQDWTVFELWSTSQGDDKESQIFEYSSKLF
jgi:hypothetical protein